MNINSVGNVSTTQDNLTIQENNKFNTKESPSKHLKSKCKRAGKLHSL